MFAAELERCAGLPGVPTSTHRAHVIFHPLSWLRPWHRETPCDVTLDLGSQAEDESSPAQRLQIPGDIRGRYRTPGEGQCDTGNELERGPLLRGDRDC